MRKSTSTLGVLHLEKIMNKEMKESIGDEYIRRVKFIRKSNLNAGNFISGMNDWVICVMRYNRGIIDWPLNFKTWTGKLEI